jgi:hypothetical protein
MVLQITSRRSRASRLRQSRSGWLYAVLVMGGFAVAILTAAHPHL